MKLNKTLYDEEATFAPITNTINVLVDTESGNSVWINASSGDPNDDLECNARVKVELHDGQLRVLVFEKGNEEPLTAYERQYSA